MANHPHSELHIPRPLSDYVIGYRPQMEGYVGLGLLPIKTVKHQSDQIRQENKGNLLLKRDMRIGPGGRRKEVDYKMDASGTYATVAYGPDVIFDRVEESDADDELQYRQRKIDHGLVAIYTNTEFIALKDILRVTGNWGSNTTDLSLTPGAQYEKHQGNGTPVEDFMSICDKIEHLCGHRPNTIVMHSMVWTQIQTHLQIVARGENQMGGGAIVDLALFERILRVDKGTIKLTTANYNVAAENQTADFRSFIGDDVIFAYNEPGKINTFGLGSTFAWSGAMDPGAGLRPFPEQANDLPGTTIAMRMYDAPWLGEAGSTVMTLTSKFDIKLLNPTNAGWLLKHAVDGTNTGLFGNALNN